MCPFRRHRRVLDAVWLHTTVGYQGNADGAAEHIKGLLQAARDKASDGYTRLINSIRSDDNVSCRVYKHGENVKSTDGTTYLCLQCPNVSKSREKHRKDHHFCENTTQCMHTG